MSNHINPLADYKDLIWLKEGNIAVDSTSSLPIRYWLYTKVAYLNYIILDLCCLSLDLLPRGCQWWPAATAEQADGGRPGPPRGD